jgi:TrmH family RNA methyltransferase
MEAMHENKPPQSLIFHANDPRFQHLRSLQTPQGRSRTGLYLIEGIRHVARAAEERAPIQSLFHSPGVLSNPFGQKLTRRLRQSGIPSEQLTLQLYRDLTLAAEPQGLGAVVRQQWSPITKARPSARSLWLAVESIDSPGNLGTIIRTAEAAGVTGIVVIGANADPYDPTAIRASMGSLFSRKLVRCSVREFTDWARAFNVAIVGSSPAGLLDYRSFRCRWPTALLIGSEKHGLSDQLAKACDFMIRIPMLGRGDSINAAVAAGILLYELFDQRRALHSGDIEAGSVHCG